MKNCLFCTSLLAYVFITSLGLAPSLAADEVWDFIGAKGAKTGQLRLIALNEYEYKLELRHPLTKKSEVWEVKLNPEKSQFEYLRKFETTQSQEKTLLCEIIFDEKGRRRIEHWPGISVVRDFPKTNTAWQEDLGLWFLLCLPFGASSSALENSLHYSLSGSPVTYHVSEETTTMKAQGRGSLSQFFNRLEYTPGHLKINFKTNWTMSKLELIKAGT